MVVSNVKSPPPARDYPNVNALHAIRLSYDATPPQNIGGIAAAAPNSGLKLNTPIPIGTIPAKSFVTDVSWAVLAATTGAATIDLGTKASLTRFLAAQAVNAVAKGTVTPSTTNLGYIGDTDQVIYATLKGSADLSNGIFSFVVTYYPKGD